MENDYYFDAEQYYLKQLCAHDILSKDEETALFVKIGKGKEAEKELDELEDTAENESRYKELLRIKTDGEEARTSIIRNNMRFVIKIAKKYYDTHGNTNLSDIVQNGALGLMRAVETYDLNRNTKFSTYAYYQVQRFILLYLKSNNEIISVPRAHTECVQRILRYIDDVYKETGEMLTELDAIERLGIDEKNYAYLRNLTREDHSLDELNNSPDAREDAYTTIPSLNIDVENEAINNAMAEQLKEIFDECLSEQQKTAMILRYGLFGNVQLDTLQEIGDTMHLSKERIRQILNKSITILTKKPSRRKLLYAMFESSV